MVTRRERWRVGEFRKHRQAGKCAVLHPGVRGCTPVYTSDRRFTPIRVLTSTRQGSRPIRTHGEEGHLRRGKLHRANRRHGASLAHTGTPYAPVDRAIQGDLERLARTIGGIASHLSLAGSDAKEGIVSRTENRTFEELQAHPGGGSTLAISGSSLCVPFDSAAPGRFVPSSRGGFLASYPGGNHLT